MTIVAMLEDAGVYDDTLPNGSNLKLLEGQTTAPGTGRIFESLPLESFHDACSLLKWLAFLNAVPGALGLPRRMMTLAALNGI